MNCTHCNHGVPPDMSFCPHCGQPGIFPNVVAASDPVQINALNSRYTIAQKDATARGVAQALGQFEAAVAGSRAVRNVGELELRIWATESAMVSTFERMQASEAKWMALDEWTRPRLAAGALLFPGYQQDIRFGAIALGPNPLGVENYGHFTIELKESMIAPRSSVFITNSARIVRDAGVAPGAQLGMPGDRANWQERAKLAVVKCAAVITKGTATADFPGILLTEGANSAADEFIELHIFRPMTIKTVERVITRRVATGTTNRRKPSNAVLAQVRRDLRRAGLKLEVL